MDEADPLESSLLAMAAIGFSDRDTFDSQRTVDKAISWKAMNNVSFEESE